MITSEQPPITNLLRSQHRLPCLLLLLVAACGQAATSGPLDAGMIPTIPMVTANSPLDGSANVPINSNVTAAFSELMDDHTLSAASFTLTTGTPPVAVAGTVIYANPTATFWPAAHLLGSQSYRATVTTLALSHFGVALPANYTWIFTTGTTKAPGLPVPLGGAENFVVLAKSRVSTVPNSSITGNVGVSPAAASYITGFSLSADPSNAFSTSTQVVGKVYAADYAVPTPAMMTTAIGDMERAFTDAAGRAPDVLELGAGTLAGATLLPAVYKWSSGLLLPTTITLSGSATDVWIFQIAQDLTMGNGAKVILSGGALAKNVFWQVTGAVVLGTNAHCEGIILTQTAITLRTGASVTGRLLAQTAITLDANPVVTPSP